MRRAVFALVAFSMVASCKLKSLASLVAFEGEIDMAVDVALPGFGSAGAPAMTLKMDIKGDKSRTESPGLAGLGSSVTITDASAKKMWTLDTTKKTYTEVDLSKLSAAAKAAPSPAPKPVVRKTGRSDKVAGYSCDVYEVDQPTSQTELCLASGLSMMAMGLTGPFSMLAGQDDAFGDALSHGFPLRVVMRDGSGRPIAKMEATRIDKKKLPDSEFEVPPGYTKAASLFGPTL